MISKVVALLLATLTLFAFAAKPDVNELNEAVMTNNPEKVSQILQKREVDLNDYVLSDGTSLLHLSAWKNSHAILNLLISYGGNVNLKNKAGHTPLHSAMIGRAAQSAYLLMDVDGIDVEAQDNEGTTPLMMAMNFDLWDVARKLVSKGAKIYTQNKAGLNALHYRMRPETKPDDRKVLERMEHIDELKRLARRVADKTGGITPEQQLKEIQEEGTGVEQFALKMKAMRSTPMQFWGPEQSAFYIASLDLEGEITDFQEYIIEHDITGNMLKNLDLKPLVAAGTLTSKQAEKIKASFSVKHDEL